MSMSMPKSLSNSAFLFKAECPANSWQKGKFRFGLPMDSDTSTEERNANVRGCGLCGNQAPPSWHSVLKLVPVLGRRLVLVHDHELELSSWECA